MSQHSELVGAKVVKLAPKPVEPLSVGPRSVGYDTKGTPMSLLNEYIQKEQQLKQLQEDLQRLEGDQRLKSELEFKAKLEALMTEFGKRPSDVIALLDPASDQRGVKTTASGNARRKRRLKIYKNPKTGEVIETRGGNHKGLRSWKDEYGDEAVESWLVRMED
tara:strand:- start:139 stop:627 length:489 start_codon:yes stop_codon:yes gene_type:complete